MKKPISKLVAGTMTWGAWGKNWNTNQMIDMLHTCLEHNISTFDHADIYGSYTTEAAFGKAFSESKINREKLQFISKCGIQLAAENRKTIVKHYDYSSHHIIQSVENSLQNLQTDYLDVLLLHRPSPLMQPDEIANAIQKLQTEGKIISFGVSNFTDWQTQLIASKIPVEYNQIQFSASHIAPMLDGSLTYMQAQNIVPMAWNPLGSVLQGTDDTSIRLSLFVTQLAKKYHTTPDVILLAWILKHPAAIIPVLGTTTPSRIQAAVLALQIELELEDWFHIWEHNIGKNVP